MKKILLASAMALVMGAGAANAQSADELRVYINPGHGSWTPNDRPNPVVGHGEYSRTNTDTLNFFESNTNLRKGFAVLEKLRLMGLQYDPSLNQTGERHQIGAALDMSNNIVMSHVKCGPYNTDNGTANQLGDQTPANIYYYNRLLSEIREEVDANNFDMFISIHSNAATEGTTTNYPLFLYRGWDSPKAGAELSVQQQETSRAMADKCWQYAIENPFMVWTAYKTSKNLRGDVDFYHSSSDGYLGALKHFTPGFLVEGYFHTYQPARHRAMNFDVDYIEGAAYAHGIADYFGLDKETTGDIYAVVRDKHEKFSHQYYKPNPLSDDVYLPINGAKAVLKKGETVVAEYTTDDYYNGAIVFKGVEPGDYTIEVSHADYKAAEPMAVTVKAATTSYASTTMESLTYEPPTIVYVNYPDEMNNPGITLAGEYTFRQEFTDEPVAELEGKSVRRMILAGDRLYVLALAADNTPTLLVINARTREVLANVSTEGMEGTELNCSDIQLTADGILLASAKELTQYSNSYMNAGETRGKAWIYRWDNDENGIPTGAPREWLYTQATGNWYRSFTGETFAYTGTSTEGIAILSAQTASGVVLRTQSITVANGEQAASSYHAPLPTPDGYFNVTTLGDDYRFITSPLNDRNYMVAGSGTTVALPEYEFLHTNKAPHLSQLADGLVDNAISRVSFFKYAGHSIMAAADLVDGKAAGIRLIDITDGLASARLIGAINGALPAEAATLAEGDAAAEPMATAGTTIVTRDAEDKVIDGNIAVVLLRGNKLSRFTTEGVEQPQGKAEYAYGIVLEHPDAPNYVLKFKSTGDAPAATLVLTGEGDDVVRIPMGEVVKGENIFNFDNSALEGSNYSLAIEIESKAIAKSGLVSSESNGQTVRGGVVVITDPEYDSFGYTGVSHGKNLGIDVYAPDGSKVGHYHNGFPSQGTNQSSLFRGDELRGKFVFSDWGDYGAGYWILDPLNPETTPTSLLAGEKDSKGAYTYEGVVIGGGSSCVAFQGKGENTRMFTFVEDYPAGNANNQVIRYALGTAEQITAKPDKEYSFSGSYMLQNTNVEIQAIEDGFFCAQVRGAGNNSAGTPGFFYSDNEGNVLFNSSSIASDVVGTTSGIAISKDRKIFAVGQPDKRITIFDVAWENGTPAFTKRLDISTGAVGWSQMKFDYAGNLHVFERETNGYHVYSLMNEQPKVLVPAKAEYVVYGPTVTGIEDVTVEEGESEAPAVFYNINGQRMDSENLAPGVYVKVVGGKATKVVVK